MRSTKKIKLEQYFEQTSSFITGIILIILGFILFFLNEKFYFLVIDFLILLFLLIGVKDFLLYFINYKKNKQQKFFHSLWNLLFALIISSFPSIPYSILPIVVGIYFLLNAIFQIIDLGILFKNGGRGKFLKFIYTHFYLFFSFLLILNPLKNMTAFLKFVGIYFVLIGLRLVFDAISQIIPIKYKNRLKRKIRISLPVIIECFIPYVLLNQINEALRVEKRIIYEEKKNLDNPDLEVIIHVSPNGFNRLGHVDLYFDGEIISYGNYDNSSTKFRELFGDGVIFTCEKEKYIPFCIEHSNKTLFVFGLKLNAKQISMVRSEIERIKKDLVRWHPPLEEAKKNRIFFKSKFSDYSSCLYRKTKAKFYKFTKGNFKTYFVLGNNCCLLADKIIGRSGINLLKMNGLITPGTYYEYLNREFCRKGSIVVSKNIYNERRKKDERKTFRGKI